MIRQRGAALPETAFTLTLLLALLVGAFRLALVGYAQIAADGVAFFHAHETGLKLTYPGGATTLDPLAAAHAAVPGFPTNGDGLLQPSTLPPPRPDIPTQYGFDQYYNRHGGVSLIQPLQVFSKATRRNLDSLLLFGGGGVLSVTGVGVDPAYQETGAHGNIFGVNFQTADASNNAVDYFSAGENTPPYFAGFHYLQYCPTPDDPTLVGSWQWCPNGSNYLALGLAEYLDTDNWGRPQIGISPEGSAVFWETLYHQQVFANISQALPPDITTPEDLCKAQRVLDTHNVTTQCFGDPNPLPYNADVLKVYSWDSTQQGGYPPADYTPGNPAYALHPGAGYP